MSQHSQRTHTGASSGLIVVGVVLVLLSAVATGYMISGPELDSRDVTGFILGLVATGLLVGQGMAALVDLAVTRDREARQTERTQQARQAAERAREARNTGHWADSEGHMLSVRWEPLEGRYHVQGWMFDDYQVQRGVTWTDRHSLTRSLTHLEEAGMAPLDGEGTRTVRARLGLSAWHWTTENFLDPMRDQAPLAPPMYPELEPMDSYGRTWEQAWQAYEANHPEVVASWGKQNGRWPNCGCRTCRPDIQTSWPAFEPVPDPPDNGGTTGAREARIPLVDQQVYDNATEVIDRVREDRTSGRDDDNSTEVIDRVR